jgi:hypothetical protein
MIERDSLGPRRSEMARSSVHISRLLQIICISSILCLIAGCSVLSKASPPDLLLETLPPTLPPASSSPTVTEGSEGLSEDEVATLSSLVKEDDHPLYTMHYYGAYVKSFPPAALGVSVLVESVKPNPMTWACSLFAALGDNKNMLYGRNFDWEYSPALLLFTHPPDGYTSVSMVDIAYLGYGRADAGELLDLPLNERQALLYAPSLPFDGMNEHGLAVGIAAVPPGHMLPDPDKATIDSLMVVREMLDRARTVDEAVDILGSYNIDMGYGPPLHYLIADRTGRSALVEFYQGEMVVLSNDVPWNQATNFLRALAGGTAEGICWRYDRISQSLSDHEGRLDIREAIDLLRDVSQDETQWSIVYGMHTGEVDVVMGQRFDTVYTFSLSSSEE